MPVELARMVDTCAREWVKIERRIEEDDYRRDEKHDNFLRAKEPGFADFFNRVKCGDGVELREFSAAEDLSTEMREQPYRGGQPTGAFGSSGAGPDWYGDTWEDWYGDDAGFEWTEECEGGSDRAGEAGEGYLGTEESVCWKHLSEAGCHHPGCKFIHMDQQGMGWCPSEQQKRLLAHRVRNLTEVQWNWSKIRSFELDTKIFDPQFGEDRSARQASTETS